MTSYFTENEIDAMYGCVLNAIDNLNAIKKELNKDFKAPWYILEKVEKIERFVRVIQNRAEDAQNRAIESEEDDV